MKSDSRSKYSAQSITDCYAMQCNAVQCRTQLRKPDSESLLIHSALDHLSRLISFVFC